MYLDIQGFLGIIGDKTRKRNSNKFSRLVNKAIIFTYIHLVMYISFI